jgi:iron complex outermembrane receptor protein
MHPLIMGAIAPVQPAQPYPHPRLRPAVLAWSIACLLAGLPMTTQAESTAAADSDDTTVYVTAPRYRHFATGSLSTAAIARQSAYSSDTAALLHALPGVHSFGAGGVSSLPVMRGLADDRLRIKLDDMDLIASCPNHMNPALSYIDPSQVASVQVWAGISPVSVGGDSIGGTIAVRSKGPRFAAAGQDHLKEGEIGAFYRSNGNAHGGHVTATYATDSVSLSYTSATAKAGDYKAGGDFKNYDATGRTGHTLGRDVVGSTAYETRNHTLDLAFRNANNLFEAKLGYQDIPYQLYPNQRMDMLDNEQKRFLLRYQGDFAWGSLEARAYQEKVNHYMNFGEDKQLAYGTAINGMPMYTKGKTTGASIKANVSLAGQNLLRMGAELQQYHLNDWWPPSGTGGMAPNTFINIQNGKRDRAALFSEWEAHFNPRWISLLGLRYERVRTSADAVHGYNQATAPFSGSGGMMNQTVDAVAFNNAQRAKTDNNVDLTALTRYTPDEGLDVELGLARKVRSPNLYERYSWSTAGMMAIMNNFVGDGNGYVGNTNLKPEIAHTLSASFDWHAPGREWEFKASPYYTRATDYIDAIKTASWKANQFNVLQYANQSARLYGIDLSGKMPLANTRFGAFGLKGQASYTNGKNRDTGDDLYNIMPLNAKFALTHQTGGWDNALELEAVSAKRNVSDIRNEIRTTGYGLVHLRGSYAWNKVRLDFGVENLFDRNYALPLGGAYTGQGNTMSINPTNVTWGTAVPGPGRSVYTALTLKF